ncbi:MAG: class I SAM-dependent methyltransferase [Bryobacteraceae bacterium]
MSVLTTPFEGCDLHEAEWLSRQARRYFAWQRELAAKEAGKRVVEVGCGNGDLTRQLLSREKVVAVDRQPERVARLLNLYGDARNLEALSIDVSTARFRELAAHQPDSVVCLHGLARAEDDLLALFNMSSVLPQGGKIVISVPAFPALYGPVDFALGFLRRYTKDTLRESAAKVGLNVLRIDYSNFFGFFRWWLRSKLAPPEPTFDPDAGQQERSQQPGTSDRLTAPLAARIESLLAPPIGQDLFAVLQRP